jgi:hypothetical protein
MTLHAIFSSNFLQFHDKRHLDERRCTKQVVCAKIDPLPNKIGNNIVHSSGKHILWRQEIESKKS